MRSLRAMVTLAVVASAVSGCAAVPGAQPSEAVPPRPSASSEPSRPASPDSEPQLAPDGTAADNLPLFTAVTESVWASGERGSGRAYVDALALAGFDKSSMQVTADQSTVGNAAESIQFSVLWGNECLIGQVGPATGDPYTVVVPELSEGGCLIGATRPIDW